MAPTATSGKTQTQPTKKKKTPQKKIKKQQQQPKSMAQKQLTKEVVKVEKKVKKLQRKTNGPKVSDTMSTSVTLGIITGQDEIGLTRQMRIPLNPLLAKASEGKSTTPLSIRASCYELWKLKYAEVIATPLTGYSNICGSVGYLALTLNGLEAGADSIDSLKARKHIQLPLGRLQKFRLQSRELEGPREGWWLVDTSQSPADAYGPAIDVFLAYKTENLLSTSSGSTNVYKGPLWQLELRVTYFFSTYQPKPGLQSLVSDQFDNNTQVTVKHAQDGSIIMETSDQNLIRVLTPRTPGQTAGKSQTVWAVAGAAVNAAATVMGPWGWLLKGGFWLVRRIFGTGTNAVAQYQVYPSILAAMEDQPIYGGTGDGRVSLPVVHVSEVMNPNSEENDVNSTVATNPIPQPSLPPFRPESQLRPNPQGNTGGQILFGNFAWQKKFSASVMWFGVASKHQDWNFAAVADLDSDNLVLFSSSTNPQGAVGTGSTWLRSLQANWSTLSDWLPTPTKGTELHLPHDMKSQFHMLESPEYAASYVYVRSPETNSETQTRNKIGQQAVLIVSKTKGGVLCVTNGQTNVEPGNYNFLNQVVYMATQPAMQTNQLLALSEDFQDDISLADSFLGCADPVEEEREQLLSRLREIDLSRFCAG
uniref:Capsid n=1 Tax=Avastrovirus 2 TaxID=1239438 RepID=K7TIQ9_9VIRU|nr:capsid [Avastrovirus 2]